MPGLYERARWHNGQPPLDNATHLMPWSNPALVMAQGQEAGGSLAMLTPGQERQQKAKNKAAAGISG